MNVMRGASVGSSGTKVISMKHGPTIECTCGKRPDSLNDEDLEGWTMVGMKVLCPACKETDPTLKLMRFAHQRTSELVKRKREK